MIQTSTIDDPTVARDFAEIAVSTVSTADAMGLLPRPNGVGTLNLDIERLLSYLHLAGIGQGIQFDLADRAGTMQSLQRLNSALETSPAPEFEWVRMEEVLGLDLLSKLVGVAIVSIRRYLAKTRTTPDNAAARLHVLSLIVGNLNGAYNEAGIRQWFQRRRTQLGGKSPMELLTGNWRPDDEIVARLRALAGGLVSSPAT